MLKNLFFCAFFISAMLISGDLGSQIIPITGIEPQTFLCPSVPKDTLNKVFIRGRVTRQGEPKMYLSKANVQLKNTDLSISTDSLGYYWLDISEMSDASNNYILQCSFVNHQSAEKIIDHKIEKTTIVNFDLVLNGGIAPPEIKEEKPVKKKKKSRRHK